MAWTRAHNKDGGHANVHRVMVYLCAVAATVTLACQLKRTVWSERVRLGRVPRALLSMVATFNTRPSTSPSPTTTAPCSHGMYNISTTSQTGVEPDTQNSSASPALIQQSMQPSFEEHQPRVKIVYATESGNAEALAKILYRHLHSCGVLCSLINPGSWTHLDDYLFARARNKGSQILLLPARDGTVSSDERAIYIFVVATAGAGEPPSNFAPLYYMMESAARRYSESIAHDANTSVAHVPADSDRRLSNSSSSSSNSNSRHGDNPDSSRQSHECSDAADRNVSPVISMSDSSNTTSKDGNDNTKSSASSVRIANQIGTADTIPSVPPPFANIHFAVFGLGDSLYRNYCRCAIMTKSALKRGGATEMHKIGFADASRGNQEHVFMSWLSSLVTALSHYVTIAPDMRDNQNHRPQGQLELQYVEQADSSRSAARPYPALISLPLRYRAALSAPRKEDGSAFYRLGFDAAEMSFEAGDHLGVYPRNPSALVRRCACLLRLSEDSLDSVVELTARHSGAGCDANGQQADAAGSHLLPARVSLRTVLTYYVDLHARPRPSMLRVLAQYCTDDAEQRQFLRMLEHNYEDGNNNEGCGEPEHCGVNSLDKSKSDASEQVRSTWMTGQDGAKLRTGDADASGVVTVLDYMQHFSGCCVIPLAHFIEMMPRIQPRYYSIASDPVIHEGRIEILVRAQKGGLCSDFLCRDCSLHAELVTIFVRHSTFHLPTRRALSRPVIFIGPGTGVAGPLGLCHRRERTLRQRVRHTAALSMASGTRKADEDEGTHDESGESIVGPCVFFFGAQHKETEYLVAEEMQRWVREPTAMAVWDESHLQHRVCAAARVLPLTKALPCPVVTLLDCAFSRDQAEKVYVTDLISKHADYLYTLLTEGDGALIFVSGSAAGVGKEVDRSFTRLLQEKGKLARLAAMQFLQNMERDHCYVKDVY